MTRTAVDLAALDRWSADATRVRAHLASSLSRADGVVTRLDVRWHGDASSAFADRYADWQAAAGGLTRTLDELVALVDTAHTNYRAALAANARMWSGSTAPTIAAMSTGAGGLDADPDDIRATAATLVRQRDRLDNGWRALGAALGPMTGMAGADPAAVGFGADHDALAAAAWSGWRAARDAVTALADSVAATGNNVLVAEHASTAGNPAPPALIPGSPPAAVVPPAPPAAAGPGTSPPPGPFGEAGPFGDAWPTGDPDRLHTATRDWRAAADVLWDASGAVTSTLHSAAATSPALMPLQEYVDTVVRDDCVGSFFATLRSACGRLAMACDQLADQIVRTRQELRDAVLELLDDDEWYHPVGLFLDATLARGLASRIALAGDLTIFNDAVELVLTEHERAVARIRDGLAPAANELTRAAATLPRPEPVTAHMTPVGPAPVLGPGVRTIDPPPLVLTRAQVEKKYDQHAAAFGITAPRSREGFAQLDAALRTFVESYDTVHIAGTYRSQPTIIHVDPRRHLVVLQLPGGAFVSGWTLTADQEKNIMERGSL